jgi:hypothetical protein
LSLQSSSSSSSPALAAFATPGGDGEKLLASLARLLAATSSPALLRPLVAHVLPRLACAGRAQQDAMITAGMAAPLAALLQPPGASLAGEVADVISTLALNNPTAQSTLGQAGALPRLLTLMACPLSPTPTSREGSTTSLSLSLSAKSCRALSSLVMGHPGNQALALQGGGVTVLLLLLRTGVLPVMKQAVGALANLVARQAEAAAAVAAAGVQGSLVALLDSKDAVVRERTAMLIGNLTISQTSQDLFGVAGAVPS